MKKFLKPDVEVVTILTEDVITASSAEWDITVPNEGENLD